ncbi:hypothetical protein MKX03_000112 [Papaver bracteatum]|nr:hypothetical protein MKX03_000112 [Papaver bracteatum]
MYQKTTRDIALWNPATRQFRLLLKSSNGNPKVGYYHTDFVGIGFDVETKDYKVIKFSSFEPKTKQAALPLDRLPEVQIYCLTSNSWRLIDSDFPAHCCIPSFGRSLNGIYFHQCVDYTAADPIKRVILSFDLSKKKYQRVLLQIPENNLVHLESIGDKLACITATMGCFGQYKVWMLNDFNTTKELWTEIYRFELRFSRILSISWNGKFGLFMGNTLVLHNFVTADFQNFGFGGINMYALTANIYKESLVSVHANGSATKAISS